MSHHSCLRCGHGWYDRLWSGSFPKRCASCRSPYWNKPYVRNMVNSGVLNPMSSFNLTFKPSHIGPTQLEIPADKYVHVKGAKLNCPGVVRSKISGRKDSITVKSGRRVVSAIIPPAKVISKRVKKPARLVSVKGSKIKHKTKK